MSITIYHNPKCSKSRATLELLKEKGIDPNIVLYLESPLAESELADIITKLGIIPRNLVRFNEQVAQELDLNSTDDRMDAEWIERMVKNPILIERPIVTNGYKAAIGRPPENVLKIID